MFKILVCDQSSFSVSIKMFTSVIYHKFICNIGDNMVFDFLKKERNPEELFDQATSCLQNNENEKAVKLFDEVLEIIPDHIHSLNGKGSGLMQAGRMKEAEEVFMYSLSVSESEMAYLNLALIAKNKKDYETAIKYCDKGAEIQPELEDVATVVKNSIKKEMAESSSKIVPDDLNAEARQLIAEGDAFFSEMKYWDALEAFESALVKDSSCANHVNPLIDKTKIKILGKFIYFNIFEQEGFPNGELDRLKVQSYKEMVIDGNYAAALLAMDEILSIDNRDLDALNMKGSLLFYFDRNEEAIECFDKCLEIDNPIQNFYASFNKGLVLRRMYKLPEALDIFDELLKEPAAYDLVKPYQREILDKLEEFMGVKLY